MNVTVCPPMPAHGLLSPQPQFASRLALPACAGTRIAFSDYDRMGTFERKRAPGRRAAVPNWALNDEKLRLIICRYYEVRAGFDGPQPGTYSERLTRAHEKLLQCIPRWAAAVDKLCLEFVELKRNGSNPPRLMKLQSLIEGVDSQIIAARRGPGFLAAIVYEYFRCGSNSVEVGAAVGLKPPAVRQLILRMSSVAAKIANGTDVRKEKRKKQQLCIVCGIPCPQHSKYCSKSCKKKYHSENPRKKRNGVAPKFCSSTCREIFKHPAPIIVSGGFGVPMEEAKSSGQGQGYEEYLKTADRLGVKPMPFLIWSELDERRG